jgi:hypothetical protein
MEERRDKNRRAEVVRCVLNRIVQNPSITLTVDTMQQWLQVPIDGAERILGRLVDSGLMREVRRGEWARGTWPGAQREWY